MTPITTGTTTVRGTVSSVTPDNRTFTVDTGKQKLEVDTRNMPYNPLDDVGFQQIDQGDRVSVTGPLNQQFFNDRVLEANVVITLLDDPRKGKSKSQSQNQKQSRHQDKNPS